MKIQAHSCAERAMEQVEHPLFTAQKGRVQFKHSWMPLNSCSNNCTANNCSACSAWALTLWALGLQEIRDEISAKDTNLFIQLTCCCMASKITSVLVEKWGILSLAGFWHVSLSRAVMTQFWHCCWWLCISVTWDFLFCSSEYLCSGSVWGLCMGKYQLKFCPLDNNWKIPLSYSFSCICLQSFSWKCLRSIKPRLTEQNGCCISVRISCYPYLHRLHH